MHRNAFKPIKGGDRKISARFARRGPHFTVLPMGLEKLSVALAKVPNKFENDGATSQELISCIALYCLKNNWPQSAAVSSGTAESPFLSSGISNMDVDASSFP